MSHFRQPSLHAIALLGTFFFPRKGFEAEGLGQKNTYKYFSEFKSEDCIYHRKELCRISTSAVKLCCGIIVEEHCRQTTFTAFYRRTSTFVLFELKKLWNHLPTHFTLELTKS